MKESFWNWFWRRLKEEAFTKVEPNLDVTGGRKMTINLKAKSVSFDEVEYEITEITTYESGNQVIELLNTETREETAMTIWAEGY
jgi:hypothetical protein